MTEVDPTRCPLCGQPNRCAMACRPRSTGAATSPKPCWCNAVTIPQTVLDAVPTDMRGTACLCMACACPDDQPTPR